MHSPPPQNLPSWLQVACCCTCQRCVKLRGEAAGATNRDQHSRLHHACTRTVQYSTYNTVLCCTVVDPTPKSPRAQEPSPNITKQPSLDPHQHPTAVTLDPPQSLSPATLSLHTPPSKQSRRQTDNATAGSHLQRIRFAWNKHTHSCPKAAGSSVPTDDRNRFTSRTPGKRKLRETQPFPSSLPIQEFAPC